MKVHTTKGDIVELDNLQFSGWLYEVLIKLQFHTPSLRLEGRDWETKKPIRLALMQIELDWQDVLTLNG